MAKKTPPRPRKKRASFEDAFAMALRTTFAQNDEREDASVSLESVSPESVSLDSVSLESVSLGKELPATPKPEANDSISTGESSPSEQGVTPSSSVHVDEMDVQSEQTKQAGEVISPIEQAKETDETSVLNTQTKHTDEAGTQNKLATCADESGSDAPHAQSNQAQEVHKASMQHTVIIDYSNNEQTKETDEISILNELTKQTNEDDLPNKHTPRTDEIGAPNEHTKCYYEVSKQNKHTKTAREAETQNIQVTSAPELDTRNEHTKQYTQINTRNIQTNRTDETSTAPPSPFNPQLSTPKKPSLLKVRLQKSLIESKAEHAFVAYLQANGDHVSSYALISQETGITLGTLRRCVKKFVDYNLISTTKYCGRGKMQGIIITIRNLQAAIDNIQITHRSSAKQLALYERNIQAMEHHAMPYAQAMDPAHTGQYLGTKQISPTQVGATIYSVNNIGAPFVPHAQSVPHGQSVPHAQSVPAHHTPYAENLYAKNTPYTAQTATQFSQYPAIVQWLLTLTDADITALWPTLSAIHFGSKQIRQALQTLQAQGKTFDQQFGEDFKQGLNHADFALGTEGGIKDRHGRVVSKPCGYIYSSFAKDGYYAAPENYISPKAQRATDEAARLEKERLATENLDKELQYKTVTSIEQELNTLLAQGETSPLYCQLRDSLPHIARHGEESRSPNFKRAMRLALKEYSTES